jgi:hypothetical protein
MQEATPDNQEATLVEDGETVQQIRDPIDEIENPPLFGEEAAKEAVRSFLNDYFAETTRALSFEDTFTKEVGAQKIPIDYIKCRRFLTTALNNLKEIDFDLIKGALLKLHKDTESLFNYYAKFRQDNKSWSSIFEVGFLKRIKIMSDLELEMNSVKTLRDSYDGRLRTSDEEMKKVLLKSQTVETEHELKRLKLVHGDLVHHFATARERHAQLLERYSVAKELLRKYFEAIYRVQVKSLESRFVKCVNFKAFCLDKLLWAEAEDNPHVRAFFETANIPNEYSMKTFITYYLRNVDFTKSKENEWHNYLKELLEMMD